MGRVPIPSGSLVLPVIDILGTQWMVLTAGEHQKGRFNMMTISWGTIGVIWGKPAAMVLVRPSRYTRQFMERYDSFTLSAFPRKYHDKLSWIGANSGREGDKAAASGLTPIPSSKVAAPGWDEADLIIECRKIYIHDLNPKNFIDDSIMSHYPSSDNFHRMYIGEILAIEGMDKYRLKGSAR